jgi:hypothetical protein
MSFYDTIRCAWYDPAFLLKTHADALLGGFAMLVVMACMWAW